jgi:hypothetical protein
MKGVPKRGSALFCWSSVGLCIDLWRKKHMKKTTFFQVLLIAAIILLVGIPMIIHAQGNSQTPPRRDNMQLYEGDGWWFFYPMNATLEQAGENTLKILGPDIRFRAADYDVTFQGPAYEMQVWVYDNPERVFPEVFAQEQIIAEWQELRQGGPNPLPVLEDGVTLDPEKVSSPIIANLPAFKAQFFGGDSYVYRVYIGTDPMVVFNYVEQIPENHPLALMQTDIYDMIINSFGTAD